MIKKFEKIFIFNFILNFFVQEIIQCEYELEHSNSSLKQQEDLEDILTERNEDIERLIQQHEKQIIEFEIELIKLDDLIINSKFNFSKKMNFILYINFQLRNKRRLAFSSHFTHVHLSHF